MRRFRSAAHRDPSGGAAFDAEVASIVRRPSWRTVAGVFERFSDQARDVLSLAAAEARQLGHGHIGTEHLLLGILVEATSPASTALADSGTTLSGCRELAAELVGNRGGPSTRSGDLPYTERANRSLERASRLALRRRDPAVEPSHILLSVLDVEGRAGQVLRGLSVDPETVRRHLESRDSAGSADSAPRGAATASSPAGGAREVRGPEPACASCGAGLGAHLGYRVMDASGADGATAGFLVAYCLSCGAAIGAGPA
jgi:hypothetical protein